MSHSGHFTQVMESSHMTAMMSKDFVVDEVVSMNHPLTAHPLEEDCVQQLHLHFSKSAVTLETIVKVTEHQ